MQLLRAGVLKVKQDFNEGVDKMLQQKKIALSKIHDNQARIKEILEELGHENSEPEYDFTKRERADWPLKVLDSEVGIEKILTEEERRHNEELRAEDAKMQQLGIDEERNMLALKEMMDGTLEKKKINVVEEREPWMDQPLETLSDDQKKKLKEYEEKLRYF